MQTILTPAALPFCYIYQHFVYVATVAVSVECTVTEILYAELQTKLKMQFSINPNLQYAKGFLCLIT